MIELASSSEIPISTEAMLVYSGSFPKSESESSSETIVSSESMLGSFSHVCTCGVGDTIIESIESEELSTPQAVLCSAEMPQAGIHTEEFVDTGTKETDFFVFSTFSTFSVFFLFSGIMYLWAGEQFDKIDEKMFKPELCAHSVRFIEKMILPLGQCLTAVSPAGRPSNCLSIF